MRFQYINELRIAVLTFTCSSFLQRNFHLKFGNLKKTEKTV